MGVIKPDQRHAPLTHGRLRPTPQQVGAIYLDEVRIHGREELPDLPIIRQDAVVRIVKKSGTFNYIQRGGKEGLLAVVCSGDNHSMTFYLTMVSQITRLLKEIGVHTAYSAINVQGGKITYTHHAVLVFRVAMRQVSSYVIAVDGSPSSLRECGDPTAPR
jgi:hypothetical protein